MTQVPPPDPALEAPALISTGAEAIVQNAGRLGLTWDLILATVSNGDNPNSVTATCDGDDVKLTMVSMVGPLAQNERVFVIKVPPSGLFIVGRSSPFTFPFQWDIVTTLQLTSSNTFGDLTTVGPVVDANIGISGAAIIVLSAELLCDDLAFSAIMSFEITGATSLATNSTSRAVYLSNLDAGSGLSSIGSLSRFCIVEDLNPGVNTITAKYRARNSGGQVGFGSRIVAVLPL